MYCIYTVYICLSLWLNSYTDISGCIESKSAKEENHFHFLPFYLVRIGQSSRPWVMNWALTNLNGLSSLNWRTAEKGRREIGPVRFASFLEHFLDPPKKDVIFRWASLMLCFCEWSAWRTALVAAEEALSFANMVGFPVLVRPSYVLSGAAMRVIDNEDWHERKGRCEIWWFCFP